MYGKRNKFSARKTEYNGAVYDSKREADYAFELDLRTKAGEITTWSRQIALDLVVNGTHVCYYTIDFVVYFPDGHHEYHEVKGYATDTWRLKWKLYRALYPEHDAKIIK